jgi:hypothetical protein
MITPEMYEAARRHIAIQRRQQTQALQEKFLKIFKQDDDADYGAGDVAAVVDSDADTIAERAVRWLLRTGKFADEQDARDWLTNKKRGQAWLARNCEHFKKRRAPKGTPEPSAADLRAAKADVVRKLSEDAVAVAKAIVSTGNTYSLSRDEFTHVVEDYATRQHPQLTKHAAFAKALDQHPELHQALRAIREKFWADAARRDLARAKIAALPRQLGA